MIRERGCNQEKLGRVKEVAGSSEKKLSAKNTLEFKLTTGMNAYTLPIKEYAHEKENQSNN